MNFPIHESKTSDKVIRIVAESDLTDYCSKAYAKKMIEAKRNGQFWGAYFTKSGRIKATFC